MVGDSCLELPSYSSSWLQASVNGHGVCFPVTSKEMLSQIDFGLAWIVDRGYHGGS